MKHFIAALTFVALSINLHAQHIFENVDFDYYSSSTVNDYSIWFSNGLGYEQLTTGGITGGCLATPDSNLWGNFQPTYCYKIKTEQYDTAVNAVSFKYDTTDIDPSAFNRAVSIWLVPSADFNHYSITAINYDKSFQLITYSTVNNPQPVLPLEHGHWYELKVRHQFIPGFAGWMFTVDAYVYDLGIDGLQTPVLIEHESGGANDEIFPTDTAISVQITGSRYGGSSCLDNFYFDALPSADSCDAELPVCDLEATSIDIACNGDCNGSAVASAVGSSPLTYLWSNGSTDSDVNGLCPGTYMVTLTDANGCTAIATTTITEPPVLLAADSVLQNASCATCADGSASVSASGGNPAYTIVWSNGSTDMSIANVLPGVYTYTVTDANGCTASDSVNIQFETGIPNRDNAVAIHIYPNPSNETAVLIIEGDIHSKLHLVIYDAVGKMISKYDFIGNKLSINTSTFAAGLYQCELKDDPGKVLNRAKLLVN
jgi:hypothetical protein